jgi:hypothetical protein
MATLKRVIEISVCIPVWTISIPVWTMDCSRRQSLWLAARYGVARRNKMFRNSMHFMPHTSYHIVHAASKLDSWGLISPTFTHKYAKLRRDRFGNAWVERMTKLSVKKQQNGRISVNYAFCSRSTLFFQQYVRAKNKFFAAYTFWCITKT